MAINEHARTPAGILATLSDLLDRVGTIESHFAAVVEHLSNGGAPFEIPTSPPAAPVTPTIEQTEVANAFATLTEEQKAALRALLG